MLYAALQKMKEAYPDARFAMAPTLNKGAAPYLKRAELSLLQKSWLWQYGFQWGNLAALAPGKIRELFGIVLDKEIDLVLDAAGFAYSDQWGFDNCLELANSCIRWKKNDTKVILLPQAFGPFSSSKIKNAVKSVVDNSDLIFARERVSYKHLVDVVGERQNIKIAPDFTNLVKGILPKNFDSTNHRFCIVPNYRMIDKTSREKSETYIPFMIKCAKYLLEKNQKPFILIHEGEDDIRIAKKICNSVGGKLPIIKENHPLKIKGILGSVEGTIGSRFHGLVSALSQGIPSLATGWSHKYRVLFEDYGFAEGIMDVQASEKKICEKIDLIVDSTSKQKIKKKIDEKSLIFKHQTEKMWQDIFCLL